MVCAQGERTASEHRTTAEALRDAFDAAFAAPERARRNDLVPLLAIRVGGEAAAVRVLETAGLMPARKIVAVPSRRAELLGVSGVRGAVVPIYRLAALLGRAEAEEPRWVVLAAAPSEEHGDGSHRGAEQRVGLAFPAFERHLLVPATGLKRVAEPGARAHVREVVQWNGEARPLLSVESLVRAITIREGKDGA